MTKLKLMAHIVLATSLMGSSALAATSSEIRSLRKELKNIKKTYEKRISDLENKSSIASTNNRNASRNIYGNSFNPSIGIILNGQYSNFSKRNSEFAGFAVGEEGERGKKGFSIGESELNFSANIDDKFVGSLTAAIVNEDGADKVELEEAFIRTSPGFGLPTGLEIKAGRAFWNLGYLNEHHAHTDDFADRPLPYRAFLNKSFNDDGAQISYVLPTDLYVELGGGSFRGDDFPFGGGDGSGAYSAYARIGSDIGQNQNWRLGFSMLSGDAKGERITNENTVKFLGDSELYIADLRYVFAPTGNAKNQEIIFQGEYFLRNEDGTYEDTNGTGTGKVRYQDETAGWYAQAVYKFLPQWRVGFRYSQLLSSGVPAGLSGSALDAGTNDPESYSTMIDWTNSEFSRIRFQYNHEELSDNVHDNHFILQYVMSFGAHGAHQY